MKDCCAGEGQQQSGSQSLMDCIGFKTEAYIYGDGISRRCQHRDYN
jgi:hypothetical protein